MMPVYGDCARTAEEGGDEGGGGDGGHGMNDFIAKPVKATAKTSNRLAIRRLNFERVFIQEHILTNEVAYTPQDT